MRRQISRWQPGTYEGLSHLESPTGTLIPIPVRVTLSDGHAVVDLRDCPDQVPTFLNSPIANTASAVNVAMLYLSDDAHVLNDGSTRAIEVLTRSGSIVDPLLPAPVVTCTSLASAAIIEAVLMAMEAAAPEVAIAGFARRFRFALAGTDRDHQAYIWHFFFNKGGTGASDGADGWTNLGGIHNPGGTPAPSLESTEANYPFLIEEYSLRPEAGGVGRHRGGPGGSIRIRYEGLEPAILNAAGDGVVVPPRGILGGADGLGHAYTLHHADGGVTVIGPRDAGVTVRPGDVIQCLSAGGGGYGAPLPS